VVTTGSLVAVAVAYVAPTLLATVWLLAIDAPRRFPFLRKLRARHSWRWTIGQFARAAPFAVAGVTELALVNLPVLMVSALVADRTAVAQWGLSRIAAGGLRTLCMQAELPLAARPRGGPALCVPQQPRPLSAPGAG